MVRNAPERRLGCPWLAGEMINVPENLAYLLERPFYGVLGTIRPDATVQVSPMWFERVGDTIRFTHTVKRAKYRNLQANPSMSFAVFDPELPFRHLELRGHLAEVIADPEAAFFERLAARYGKPEMKTPDAPDRVILVMQVDRVVGH